MTIKGLIFDFDGLILDTELPEFQVWEDIYKSYGLKIPLDMWLKTIGTKNESFDVFSYLENNVGNIILDRHKIICQQKSLFDKKMKTQRVRPGVKNYIKDAKNRDLKIAIASSSPFDWLEKYLTGLDVLDSFDIIVTSNDVKNVKPSPDLYNLALQKLNIKAPEAISFEDSYNGILAAKSADIFCVAVPNGITSHMNLDIADMIITSLESIELDQIIQYFYNQSIA